jgi:ferredoxin-NADP reductase
VRLRGPRNHFRINEDASCHLLIAGGIGITPILAMADTLKDSRRDYQIHFAGRGRASMAFVQRLQRDHGQHLTLYCADEGARVDLAALVGELSGDAQIYVCGPSRMIEHLQALTVDLPADALRFEHFSSAGAALDPSRETGFDVELNDSGVSVHVPPDKTMLQVLRSAGIDIASDCEEGLCGSCEVAVIDGDIDHRDKVLSNSERAANQRMMSCCSRARDGGRLKLAL